jgi:hypothetical protein
MDYDTDDDRIEMAEQLAGHDPRAAAEVFRAIAHGDSVDDDVRSEAASRLDELDEGAAAEAFRGVPDDRPRHGHPLEGTLTLTPPPPSPPRPPRPPR